MNMRGFLQNCNLWINNKFADRKKIHSGLKPVGLTVHRRAGGLLTLGLRPGSKQRLEEAGPWAAPGWIERGGGGDAVNAWTTSDLLLLVAEEAEDAPRMGSTAR